jgi:YggT family protein
MSPALATLIVQLLGLLSQLVGLLQLIVVIGVILSWLIAFDVINVRNRMVYQIVSVIETVSGRLLYPIRRFLPPIAGLDLSPLVFLLLVQVVKILIGSMQQQILLSAGVGY